MTNEEALNDILRKTFPKTIFIRGKNELWGTQSIVFSDEWLKMPYEAESEDKEGMTNMEEIKKIIVKSLDTAMNEDIAEAYKYLVGCNECPYWHDCRNEHDCTDYIYDKLEV